AAAVEGGDAHEFAAVVDVDEFAERDDTYLRSGEAPADADAHVLEADLPVARDLAQERASRVGGLLLVGERQLAGRRRWPVALGGGEIADPLVGPLLVVVGAEAVEQQLQMLEVADRPLVLQPLLERAVEALELAERLGVRGRGADQLDAGLGEPALEVGFEAEQPAGEVAAVVGEQLAREPVP